MLTNTIISKLLGMTPQGAAKWRKEKRAVISFLDQYFSKEEIEEFLFKGKIKKMEEVDEFIQFKEFTIINLGQKLVSIIHHQNSNSVSVYLDKDYETKMEKDLYAVIIIFTFLNLIVENDYINTELLNKIAIIISSEVYKGSKPHYDIMMFFYCFYNNLNEFEKKIVIHHTKEIVDIMINKNSICLAGFVNEKYVREELEHIENIITKSL
ncbi:MAG: hypothetical protein PHE60_05730 [Sulfurospirillaceae bacterium]|nr:hypothetical protein [Sulfurospirillaceae bacterium]